MNIRLEIFVHDKLVSDEVISANSPWRALADTVSNHGYTYHSKSVKLVDGIYTIRLNDGMMLKATEVEQWLTL